MRNLSNEIILMIIKFSFNIHAYVKESSSENISTHVRNLRSVSRLFNNYVIIRIQEVYLLHQYPMYKYMSGHIWKDLVMIHLIREISIDNESEIRNFEKKEDDMKLTYRILEYVGLKKEFKDRYDFLNYGKIIYRRMLSKKYEMSNNDQHHGCVYQARKFKKFYKTHLSLYYKYRCRKITRVDDSFLDYWFEWHD
ncbi:MAG TPA: hypothetical protein VIY08_00670 [Candidatus Nitrosocosmicus sp.]